MGSWADRASRIRLLLASSSLADGADRDDLIEQGLRPEDADFVAEAGPELRACLSRISKLEEDLAYSEARRRELVDEFDLDEDEVTP